MAFNFRIASLHILASGLDQFVVNVVFNKGQWYQVARDIAMMIPDLLHLLLAWQELNSAIRHRGAFSTKDLTVCAVTVTALWFLVSRL